MEKQVSMDSSLIAPCGMNCGICYAHLREKNKCLGCNSSDDNKPAYCKRCIIRNCETIKMNTSKLCHECEKYPCTRLKQLDKRYRTKYKMSMLENLQMIKNDGMNEFLKNERSRWECKTCGGVICVHSGNCSKCNKSK